MAQHITHSTVEGHVHACARGHPHGVPVGMGDAHAWLVHGHAHQLGPPAVCPPCGEQAVAHVACARAPPLGAAHAHPAQPHPQRLHLGPPVGRLGGPQAPGGARHRRLRCGHFSHHGQRIGVAFKQLGQREVVFGHQTQSLPALQGVAVPGHGQPVQALVHEPGEPVGWCVGPIQLGEGLGHRPLRSGGQRTGGTVQRHGAAPALGTRPSLTRASVAPNPPCARNPRRALVTTRGAADQAMRAPTA